MVNTTPLPLYPWERETVRNLQGAVWAPGPVWTGAENLAPPTPTGFDLRTVQPVVGGYTDYAVPAHFVCINHIHVYVSA